MFFGRYLNLSQKIYLRYLTQNILNILYTKKGKRYSFFIFILTVLNFKNQIGKLHYLCTMCQTDILATFFDYVIREEKLFKMTNYKLDLKPK